MKNSIRKTIRIWFLRFTATGVLSLIMIIGAVVNPSFMYANETQVEGFKVFHQKPLDADLATRLNNVKQIITKNPLYDPSFEIELYLNDGSKYPDLMASVRGPAFGYGFLNKAIFRMLLIYMQ